MASDSDGTDVLIAINNTTGTASATSSRLSFRRRSDRKACRQAQYPQIQSHHKFLFSGTVR
jgi:hypothetical protein